MGIQIQVGLIAEPHDGWLHLSTSERSLVVLTVSDKGTHSSSAAERCSRSPPLPHSASEEGNCDAMSAFFSCHRHGDKRHECVRQMIWSGVQTAPQSSEAAGRVTEPGFLGAMSPHLRDTARKEWSRGHGACRAAHLMLESFLRAQIYFQEVGSTPFPRIFRAGS